VTQLTQTTPLDNPERIAHHEKRLPLWVDTVRNTVIEVEPSIVT
jgi:rRNA pseudouridine-1189 N-methylase Emg1 (Nep1/Mra1 family)